MTKQRIKWLVLAVFFIVFIYGLPFWWKYATQFCLDEKGTFLVVQRQAVSKKLFLLKTYLSSLTQGILRFLLPFVILSYFNFKLVREVQMGAKKRAEMSRSESKEIAYTKLAIAIISLSMITSLVNIIFTAWRKYFDPYFQFGITFSGFYVEQLTIVINSSVNFLFYCYWGDNFRKEVRRLEFKQNWCRSFR